MALSTVDLGLFHAVSSGRFRLRAQNGRLLRINPEHQVYSLGLMACEEDFKDFWPPLPRPNDHAAVPKSVTSFPSSLHPQGMPVFGWLPPRHALKPQRRVVIGRKQQGGLERPENKAFSGPERAESLGFLMVLMAGRGGNAWFSCVLFARSKK